jgi:hypothetical protein
LPIPADGDFDDWFELYNPGSTAVNLAGYFLTDNLTNKFQYLITTNGAHTIPAGGYLLVWADEETGQNVSAGVPRTDLHVNFRSRKPAKRSVCSPPTDADRRDHVREPDG